jgi:hypothetical protein
MSFHWRRPSILKIERVIIIAHGQTGVLLKRLEERVYGDIIVEDGIQILRKSRLHKCIISWGLVTHIAYLPLLGDMKTIKMIVLRSTFPATLAQSQFVVAGRGACTGGKGLIVTTVAAAVMVVHVVGAFFNVVVVVVVGVVACLILRVLVALIVGMLAVGAMQMTRLVELTILEGGLAILARVLVAGATSFEAAMIAIQSSPAAMLISIPMA